MKITFILTFLVALFTGGCFGQTQNTLLEFEKVSHDFGTLKEEQGTATNVFKFKNISNQPIKLTYVRAGCGCTTPKWTTEIIQPNGTGEVSASYGTSGRPGPFNKSVSVQAAKINPNTGAIDSTSFDNKVITISGTVTPKATAPAENH